MRDLGFTGNQTRAMGLPGPGQVIYCEKCLSGTRLVDTGEVIHNPGCKADPKGESAVTETSTPKTPSTKVLRKAAKEAEIEGWAEMPREELYKLLTKAGVDLDGLTEEDSNSSTRTRTRTATAKPPEPAKEPAKKAPSTKKAAPEKSAAEKKAPEKKAPALTGVNPFKEGTNAHILTELLLKGGKREDIIKTAAPNMKWNPRVTTLDAIDPIYETDDRLTLAIVSLKKAGYTLEREGRGPESFLKIHPPKDSGS